MVAFLVPIVEFSITQADDSLYLVQLGSRGLYLEPVGLVPLPGYAILINWVRSGFVLI